MIQLIRGPAAAADGVAFDSRISAYRDAALLILDITWTEIVLDTEVFDERGEFDIATGRFTVDEAGYYIVTFSGGLHDLGDGKKILVALRKNGGVPGLGMARTTVGGTDLVAMGAAKVVSLAAGDYVSIWMYHNHGAQLNVAAYVDSTCMSAHRLS